MIVFPKSPTIGQQFTESGKTWEWDGVKWIDVSSDQETDPIFSQWLSDTPPAYPDDIPSIAGLLDETAHDLLDHTGLTGVGDMTLAGVQSVTGLKTFDTTKAAVKGSSTGKNILAAANSSATDYTNTLPAKTGTFAMTSDLPTVTSFDASIGVGGDYADIAAAQTAGKYRLKAVGNITMSADTTIANNIYLDLNGYTHACGAYNFTINSGKSLYIEGQNGVITFGYSSAKMLFICVAIVNTQLYINNITITNTSSANGCHFGRNGTITNFIANCANTRYAMFGASSADHWNGILRNGNIVGGGSSCRDVIWNGLVTSTDIGDNLTFSGTFSASTVCVQSLNGLYSSIFYTSATSVYFTIARLDGLSDAGNKVYIDGYASVKNAIVRNSRFGYVLTFRANSKFFNCYVHNNAALQFNSANVDSFIFYEFSEFNGTLSVAGHKNGLNNCKITGTTSVGGDYNIFIGCTFTGAVTLASGAEYNVFIGCIFTGGLTDSSGNSTNIIQDNI